MTTKKHTADYKQRKLDKGLVRIELWVLPEIKEKVRAYVKKLMKVKNGQKHD